MSRCASCTPHRATTQTSEQHAQINHVAFSPDARHLATASFDKSVKLWSAINGDFIATFHGPPIARSCARRTQLTPFRLECDVHVHLSYAALHGSWQLCGALA
jgi:WD40 repeat protein